MKTQATRPAGFVSILSVLLAAALPVCAAAAEVSPSSHVTEVVVYRDGALVTREARLTLPPGDHRVLLKEIPAVADPGSVRITGTGTAGMGIGGVEVSREFREPDLTPEYRALEEELQDLTRQQANLGKRIDPLPFIAGHPKKGANRGEVAVDRRGHVALFHFPLVHGPDYVPRNLIETQMAEVGVQLATNPPNVLDAS